MKFWEIVQEDYSNGGHMDHAFVFSRDEAIERARATLQSGSGLSRVLCVSTTGVVVFEHIATSEPEELVRLLLTNQATTVRRRIWNGYNQASTDSDRFRVYYRDDEDQESYIATIDAFGSGSKDDPEHWREGIE